MKNGLFKLCSMILVLAMLVNMLPMSILAQELQESLSADAEAVLQPQETAEPAQVVAELTDKRTEYTKEFLLSNGLHMATVYADPIHYEKDGKWAEIDNTLAVKTDGTVTNTAGVWNVSFPQQLSGGNVTIEKDGYTLSFTMSGELRSSGELMTAAIGSETTEQLAVGQLQTSTAAVQQINLETVRAGYEYAEAAPEKLYSQLRYDGVYQNTDILYDLQANTVKESIVMASYSSTLRGYRYTLNVGQMVPVLDDSGEITFYAPDEKTVVMVMPAPYLLDANNEFSDDIQVQLTGKGSTYTLTYLLPTQWLAAEERAWPVILDPVVQADLTSNNILDRTVTENKTYSYTWSILDAGYSTTRGKVRSYLQFVNLPAITSSDVVLKAEFSMYKVETHAASSPVEIHKVTSGPWDSQDITWKTQPEFSEKVEDYQITRKTGWYTWNLTDLVRDWYATENNGLMVKLSDAVENNSSSNNFRQFYSSDASSSSRPHLAIYFLNNNGLETYWPYTSGSAGRAGTGHVNNFTGNLTWVRSDIGFGGNRMPVTIEHIYNANDVITPSDSNNSNDSGGNSFGMGLGWRTNYNQLVYKWNQQNNFDYYIWEDGDGTDHYFAYNDTEKVYKDEDGLELTLTVGSDSDPYKYTIADKNGNKRYFDTNGRLVTLENNQKETSSIVITYTSSTAKQIDTITDGAGRTYKFAYLAGQVQNLTYYGSATELTEDTKIARISYWFDGWKLVAITEMDGAVTHYTYNSDGLLLSAQDIDGYQLSYTYNTPNDFQPYRVMSVSERDTVREKDGGSLTFEYRHNRTTLTDHNGNKEILHFNDQGNVISIQDDEGHAQYAQYAQISDADPTAKANQLRLSSKLQNTVVNLLRDSSFEDETLWTLDGSEGAQEISTAQKYSGNNSLLVRGTVYGSSFTVEADATYTLSVYAKSAGDVGLIGIRKNGTIVRSISIPVRSDWARYEIHFTNDESADVQIQPVLSGQSQQGVYFDCVQLEKEPTASRYNLVENGDFRYSGGWEPSSKTTSADTRVTVADIDPAASGLDNTYFKFTGDTANFKNIKQTVAVSGEEGDGFVLTGWAKGPAVPLSGDRKFALRARFNYSDGTTSAYATASFNPTTEHWQYSAAALVAEKSYDSILVALVYDYCLNTVYFDGIQLFKEQFGSSYTYDEDGNLISVVDLQKKNTTYEYDENTGDLLEILEDNKAKMRYEYDEYHNVIKAITKKQNENDETVDGIVYEFVYDKWGNNEKVTICGEGAAISSTADYTEDGNLLESSTNALGKTTFYGYNVDTGVLEWVQYPEDTAANRTEFEYDSMYRQATAACTTNTGLALSASYEYTDDYLTTIRTPTTTYNFEYGVFGLQKSVKVGEQELATYTYTPDQNRYLQQHAYGNGDYISYSYDTKGRPIQVVHTDVAEPVEESTEEPVEESTEEPVEESTEEPTAEPTVLGQFTVEYLYDNDGNLASVKDGATGNTITHYYDLLGRPVKSVESGTNYTHSIEYRYNAENNLEKLIETINGTERTTSYKYDSENRVTSVTADDTPDVDTDNITVTYTYDEFGRVSQQVTSNGVDEEGNPIVVLTEEFEYGTYTTTNEAGTVVTRTSGQVATYRTIAGSNTVTYSYEYDDNGNITSVTSGGKTTTYEYDSANQLIRENNQAGEYTHTWTYDNAGNILERRVYTYTTDELDANGGIEISYEYPTVADPEDNTVWGDKLTSFDGKAIEYDAIGNPTKFGVTENGSDRIYTWEHGRQLATLTEGDTTWNYTYDAGGMRTGRSNTTTGITYTYIYTGSQLTQMTVDTVGDDEVDITLTFTYDASGVPLTVTHGSNKYYYATNLQGDVVAILNSDGTTAANYTYDAWGNCTATGDDPIIDYNPLRYRGYVYDPETNLYYLQSRYYDPEVGRFLNADIFISTGQGFTGNNMFTYCGNNPVNHSDPYGMWTFGLSIGASIACWFGASVSIGIYIDDDWNFDIQWTYSVSGAEETNFIGGIGAGAGVSLQYTDRDTVYDLYGSATSVGATGGPGWYVGADAISVAAEDNPNSNINGIQLNGGFGVGLDVHANKTYTESVLPQNRRGQKRATVQNVALSKEVNTKRAKFCYKLNPV